MNLPLNNFDTTFEGFLQELPEDYRELAIECKAFCRSRKIKTPDQLMRVVLCYCGVDQVLRETAGNFTLLEERISDTAIHRRLKACGPWVKAMLSRMMGAAAPIEGHLRFIIVDGSTVQGPGAKGTWYRLHVAIDRVKLHLLHVSVTDAHEAERLGHYPLQEGDVVVGDRGYNQARQWIEQADRGVGLVVRCNPQGLNLYTWRGKKWPSTRHSTRRRRPSGACRCECGLSWSSLRAPFMPADCRRPKQRKRDGGREPERRKTAAKFGHGPWR